MQQPNPNDITVGKFVIEHLGFVVSTVVGIVTATATVVGYICAGIVKARGDRIAFLKEQLDEAHRDNIDLKGKVTQTPNLDAKETKAINRAESAFSAFSNLWRVFVLGMLIYALYLQTTLLDSFKVESSRSAEHQRQIDEHQRRTDDAIASLNKRLPPQSSGRNNNAGSTAKPSQSGGSQKMTSPTPTPTP